MGNDPARVEVEFLQCAEGEPVILRLVDGGTLNGSGLTGKGALDAGGKVAFEIKVTDNLGTHRVVVSRGGEVKTVGLWVGPLPPSAGVKAWRDAGGLETLGGPCLSVAGLAALPIDNAHRAVL